LPTHARCPGGAKDVGLGRIVDLKTHGREVSGPFGGGGDGERVYTLELHLLGVLVIRKEEEFIALNRAADGCTLLITVEIRRRVGEAAR